MWRCGWFFKSSNPGVNCACDCQVWLPHYVRDKEAEEKDSRRDQRKRLVLKLYFTKLKKKLPKLILPISGIKIYSLPDVDSDEDEEYKLQVKIRLVLILLQNQILRWPNWGRASPLQFVEQMQWWKLLERRLGAGEFFLTLNFSSLKCLFIQQAISVGYCGCWEPRALRLHQIEEHADHTHARPSRGENVKCTKKSSPSRKI